MFVISTSTTGYEVKTCAIVFTMNSDIHQTTPMLYSSLLSWLTKIRLKFLLFQWHLELCLAALMSSCYHLTVTYAYVQPFLQRPIIYFPYTCCTNGTSLFLLCTLAIYTYFIVIST